MCMKVCKRDGCNETFKSKGRRTYCDRHFLGKMDNNPLSRQYKVAMHRAKDKGVEFTISIGDIRDVYPADGLCPVFGFEMVHGECEEHGRNNSPSIDRIDPNKGYVKGNIQIISNLANSMKQNATPEQMMQFAQWVINND